MRKKTIKDGTFYTHITLIWDCSLEELQKYVKDKLGLEIEMTEALGKTIIKGDKVIIWLKHKDYVVTIAHEILHAVRFWLQDYYGIDLNKDTEEIYTLLHSFFHEKILEALDN